MQNYSYKIMGASKGRGIRFGQFYTLQQMLKDVCKNKVIMLAEVHANPPVVSLQKEI